MENHIGCALSTSRSGRRDRTTLGSVRWWGSFQGDDMTDSDELDRYRAPALDKGLDILELLAGEEEGLSQAEIAKALGRTPNEHYRMLERLARPGDASPHAGGPSPLDLQ